MAYAYKLSPFYKDVLWGGDSFRTIYEKEIPTDTTGESFEASVVPGFESHADGMLFSELLKDESMTGKGGFNLLFKLIDAQKPLSVQVHPNDALAKRLEGGLGKTECWYVLSAEPSAFLYLGFRDGVTAEDFKRATYEGGMEDILGKVFVKPGDFFFVPSGTVHAIGKGIVIAELQQSCDTTYRVYDYGRLDKNGNLRQLHKEQALLAATVQPYKLSSPEKLTSNRERLIKCPYFELLRVSCEHEIEETNGRYVLLFLSDGTAEISVGGEKYAAKKGDTFFIPAYSEVFTVDGKCTYLKMTEVKNAGSNI